MPDNSNKIAVLYIATGKYICFWKDFYDSCERFFLPDAPKHYFVFTDAGNISGGNITVIPHECRGFPSDSLFRFDMFLEIEAQLKSYDFIFFFNANMLFVRPVGNAILPVAEDGGLVGVVHPVEYNFFGMIPICCYSYERNRASRAYIPKGRSRYHYFMGGCNGGTAKDYLTLCRTLSSWIQEDRQRNISAVFHDESYLNAYLNSHPCRVLSGEYGAPEGWKLPSQPRIIIRDKVRVNPCFRKAPPGILGKVKSLVSAGVNAARWYLGR